MKLEIAAHSVNEAFARSAVAAFALPLAPSLSELSDIKTAVSEAVTNSIVHAYRKQKGENKICIECKTEMENERGVLHIKITDFGCGIMDVEKAILPFYTTLADDERSGMGFTIMQTFMSEFSLESKQGQGTIVNMKKVIGGEIPIKDMKNIIEEHEGRDKVHVG
jgi:stage II sporulation protein AB (anti-sigma F factor)